MILCKKSNLKRNLEKSLKKNQITKKRLKLQKFTKI